MLLKPSEDGQRYSLFSPTAMPHACGFLWNRHMMVQVNCRGFVKALHMQPEPGKYSYAPNLEGPSFIQPEQPLYAHHPGRFVYIKDEESGCLFSAPHEPVRGVADFFEFFAGRTDIGWRLQHLGLEVEFSLSLPVDDVVELWSLTIRNPGHQQRRLSIYPVFSIGYMSWMNQSACYRPDLNGIVASCVTPYQKSEDAKRIARLKDKTFLLYDTPPSASETSLEAFEGEGGLHRPDSVLQEQLGNGDALHEMPVAALQYQIDMLPGSEQEFRFVFGPAVNDDAISLLGDKYLRPGGFEKAREEYRSYLEPAAGCIRISTPDRDLDNFVNQWLGRQMFYHGDVNRLSTDPQTRNYLQDAMGMVFVQPRVAREALITALGQQENGGAMPDGILLHDEAELKYINQVPHSDHCVWLPICMHTYLHETNDYSILDVRIKSIYDQSVKTTFERITEAMYHLLKSRDKRGLNFIAEGDWCDPMNMVGHKGRGVSAWLSIATAYALRTWAGICEEAGHNGLSKELGAGADEISAAIQEYFWDGDWFARGITDDDVVFGVSTDLEGRIYLNPQAWAILAGIASDDQLDCMIRSVGRHLEGPHGVALLEPPYTRMREDIGRLTQKFPGAAENGSVYNHASAFYIYALYQAGRSECAFELLRKMIPGPTRDDYLQRGQLPVFIPNYYRGNWRRAPRTAGRSSQMFNTGTVSWFLRILIDGLFGLKGCREGLLIDPQLPAEWSKARVVRKFRGAQFNVNFSREPGRDRMEVLMGDRVVPDNIISDFKPGESYEVSVLLEA